RERERAIDAPAVVVGLLASALARRDYALGDHVHRLLELELLPLVRFRGAVEHLGQTLGLLDQLARGGALRAQRPLVDRRAGIALDVDQRAAAGVHELPASDRAI